MRLALLLAATLSFSVERGQAQSFESLIEGVLKQHPEEGAPPAQPPPAPGAPQPAPEAPFAPAPSAPVAPLTTEPAAPALVPVEPGPRPYTPPKIERPPEAAAPGQPTGTATVAAPAAETPTAEVPATAPSATAPTAERTRESLTVEEVNAAVLPPDLPPLKGASPLVLKAQVLLDRAGASPGVIDAYAGGNLSKAISAVETVLGLPADGVLDKAVWDALGGDAAPPVLVQYTITAEDLAYPFLASIPADYAEQARLPNLNYTSPEEMFGERFHMDERLLKALNPTADFRQAGTEIWVAEVAGAPVTEKVARIVADRALRQVRAYDAANRLIVAYPATIGSEENPSPSGEHHVASVAPNPVYPKNFVQGGNTVALELPPGPNNPAGSVWIDLTDPGYSIEGTDDPSKVGKPVADGCIRLANWDAEELAGLVEPGVAVSFQ
jgi:lipoprotein-anchoring transpeptidase ErfK/SrfK